MIFKEVTKILVDDIEICKMVYQENEQGQGVAYRNNKNLFEGYWYSAYKIYKSEIQRTSDIWTKNGNKVKIIKHLKGSN